MYHQKGLKRVLMEAVEELSSLMVEDDFLTEEELDDIMDTAMSADDDDSDLMPPGNCNLHHLTGHMFVNRRKHCLLGSRCMIHLVVNNRFLTNLSVLPVPCP